ncbi:unnamed protein product [Paramecium sonneborni]|uniref:Transmembrane protein n=1 Tax=Paramecium sonneborni TaxID=65129 RepID=A0A8S1QXD8_9CILI|nr:unnamed protein product [Paramecium sonneborni]
MGTQIKIKQKNCYILCLRMEFHFHLDCVYQHSNDQSKLIIEQETQINLNILQGSYLMSKSLAEQTDDKESLIIFMNNQQAISNVFGSQKGIQNLQKYIYIIMLMEVIFISNKIKEYLYILQLVRMIEIHFLNSKITEAPTQNKLKINFEIVSL